MMLPACNLLTINTFRTPHCEFGVISKGPGKRKDLDEVSEMVKSHSSVKEICREHTATFIRYPRGICQAVALMQAPSNGSLRDLVVHVVWGKTGTGKTHGAVKYLDQKYSGSFHIQRFGTGAEWWDPYSGEKACLFDEFDGANEVRYHRLLVLLDRFQCMLPIKGGHQPACYVEVVITCSRPPTDWYSNVFDTSELTRRLATGTCTERCDIAETYPLVCEDPIIVID